MIDAQFIELTAGNIAFLLIVGFIGGLVSGFIGSGGAFVLTPGMMSMGASGVVAVASNLCHKFPKALVGARKRHKFGQVDVKLGLVMAASAAVGVWIGAGFMESVRRAYGEPGSSLYVSVAFVVVLGVVGTFVLRDALQAMRSGDADREETHRLARWVQSVEIPGTIPRGARGAAGRRPGRQPAQGRELRVHGGCAGGRRGRHRGRDAQGQEIAQRNLDRLDLAQGGTQ